jgi:hypothetical protein
MKNFVELTVTKRQAELLASLLTRVTGELQYRAIKTGDWRLDRSHEVWSGITNQITASIGMEVFQQPNVHVERLLDVIRHRQ